MCVGAERDGEGRNRIRVGLLAGWLGRDEAKGIRRGRCREGRKR